MLDVPFSFGFRTINVFRFDNFIELVLPSFIRLSLLVLVITMSFKSMLRIIKLIYELPVLAWDVKVYFIVNQMLFYSLELDQVVYRN